MSIVDSQEIIDIFALLNGSGIDYILMRNINSELPANLDVGKDIDILVHKRDAVKAIKYFNLNQYNVVDHPHKNNTFLYGADRFVFIYNDKNNILFDLNFQIVVRSIDAGQWIPLDNYFQVSVWKNKRFVEKDNGFCYWSLSYSDEFVSLVARSVFDKKKFHRAYIKRIQELLQLVDMNDVSMKFNLIFFKFTPNLLMLIENDRYQDIVDSYFKFNEY